MTGVGVTAGSAMVASTYLTATLKQHPFGTVTMAVLVTFPNRVVVFVYVIHT